MRDRLVEDRKREFMEFVFTIHKNSAFCKIYVFSVKPTFFVFVFNP